MPRRVAAARCCHSRLIEKPSGDGHARILKRVYAYCIFIFPTRFKGRGWGFDIEETRKGEKRKKKLNILRR